MKLDESASEAPLVHGIGEVEDRGYNTEQPMEMISVSLVCIPDSPQMGQCGILSRDNVLLEKLSVEEVVQWL